MVSFNFYVIERGEKMSIGENIKQLRERKGITQRQVAGDLFISVQMLCAIETRIKQPSLMVALALAKYYGTTVEALVENNNK